MTSSIDNPRPATLVEWEDIEVCEECGNQHDMHCNVHNWDIKDGYTCIKFKRLIGF